MNLFASKYPVADRLLDLLDGKYGRTWEDWEPETLWAEIQSTFGVTASDEARAAIMAGKTLRVNPEAYESDLNCFEDINLGLNGTQPNFSVVEVCSPGEILLGYQMARQCLRDRRFSFTPAVVSYVRGCFRQAGVYAYPRELQEFEEKGDETTRDRIRARADAWTTSEAINHDDMVSVQAAKLHDIYAHVRGWVAKVKETIDASA